MGFCRCSLGIFSSQTRCIVFLLSWLFYGFDFLKIVGPSSVQLKFTKSTQGNFSVSAIRPGRGAVW